jgi:GTP-dependent dephospho-CoA kinase
MLGAEKPISEQIRGELKVPIGRVIPDAEVTREIVRPYFDGTRKTACVGDRTTERVHEFGFSPDLEIVDSLEKRKARVVPSPVKNEERRILTASNPPGAISRDALLKISESLRLIEDSKSKVRIEIKGEEDLLALPVIAFFPAQTVTFYGQPNVGLVVVTSQESRNKSRQILEKMAIRSLPGT